MNQDLERLHNLLNQSMDLLDQACELVRTSGLEPPKDTVKPLAAAIAYILQARKHVYDLEPRLRVPGK
jgi:hypothetical protein